MNFDPSLVAALTPIVEHFAANARLTPAERVELVRIAQGFACKDSAADATVSPETIRARRKRIYRKMGVTSASELISALFAFSLHLLASGERLDVGSVSSSVPSSGAAA